MSEPASTSRRRPPTIDLTATEVKPEKPAANGGETGAADEAAARAEPDRGAGRGFAGGIAASALGVLVGAAIVAAAGFGLWSAGMVPSRTAAPATTSANANAISAQLDKIQAELQSRPGDTALSSRVATVEAQMKALNESLAALNRRLDDIAVTAKGARERADAAAATADRATQNASAASAAATSATQSASAASAAAKGAAKNSVQESDLQALAARIAALEQSIKSLSAAATQKTASADDRAARAAVAAEALRATVERGAPYASELAAVKTFGADQSAVAALEPFASTGVPTEAELARALSELLPSLQPAPVTPAADAGLLGRLESNAKNLVRITPVDAPTRADASSVVAQLQADAAHADIAAALNDIARLAPPEKARAAAWVRKADARNAALAASRRIASDSLAALGHTATQ